MGRGISKPVQPSESSKDPTDKTAKEHDNQKKPKKTKETKLVKRSWNCCGVADFPYTVSPSFIVIPDHSLILEQESCGHHNEARDAVCKLCGHARCEDCPVLMPGDYVVSACEE